jgi:hypothetical protein
MFFGMPPMEKRGLPSRRRFRCLLSTDRQLGVLDPAVDLYMETISHHTGISEKGQKDYSGLLLEQKGM